jgi:hypothetical protein
MKPRITSVGGGNAAISGSVGWEWIPSDQDLARRIVLFLEDRRVLYATEGREDFEACRRSAHEIRSILTLELMNTSAGGHLEATLKRMRAASRAFVDAAGMKSTNFKKDGSYFTACLQAYRDVIGRELGLLALDYKLPLPPALQAIVPPPDPRPFVHNP